MVGGETSDVESVRPVLEAVGSTVVHVGPAGSGQAVKAANQLIVAGNIELGNRGIASDGPASNSSMPGKPGSS